MSSQVLNLPVHIPWKHVATSADMMDRFPMTVPSGASIGPTPWRSSVSIYAYEPRAEELDEAICDRRVTFFKVSTSITGYQPDKDDKQAITDYTDSFDVEIGTPLGDYFACYGVLLNVSVFPGPLWKSAADEPKSDQYPHIVDIEPKKRDLYQAATENAEVLTASRGTIKTDKSLTSVDTTELGINTSVTVPLGSGPGAPMGSAGITPKWGQTDTDSHVFSTDTGRDRREVEGSTTNLSQMYNLLTGYHAGTNRASFLMLPRPHQLQPTLQRTFVQGLREIEGIQDFFIVVERPDTVDELCIQASLETGHIVDTPEISDSDDIAEPIDADGYERKSVEIAQIFEVGSGTHTITEAVNFLTGIFGADPIRDEKPISSAPGGYTGFEVDGWEFDISRGDPGHGAVTEEILDDDTASANLDGYHYASQSPDAVIITGLFFTKGRGKLKIFHRRYTAHLRRRPVPTETEQNESNRKDLLITSRRVTACIATEDDCLVSRPIQPGPERDGVVDELKLKLGRGQTVDLNSIQAAMTSGATSLSRVEGLKRSFVDTDIAGRYLASVTSNKKANSDLEPARNSELKAISVDRLLTTPLQVLSRKHNVSVADIVVERRRIIGLKNEDPPKKPQ